MSFDLVLPDELTPAMKDALGLQCFSTGPLAHLFREAGNKIDRKIEAEQAFILFKTLRLAIEHGNDWRKVFETEVNEALKLAKAKRKPEQPDRRSKEID